jgi:ribosomal protein L12E/L44/L45/RPP1/RPP2
MKEMAAYLMLVLGGNESPTAEDVTKALSSVGVEPDSAQLSSLISELEGKDLNEVLASGTEMLAKFGSGGGGGGGGGGGEGGGGGGAAAAVKEVEEEVEEAPPAVDMFGGGGDGGDY